MKKLFLVSTPLQKTWPDNNEDIIFLGDWCTSYSKRHIWEKFNYKTCHYHWDDRKKLLSDYSYLDKLYEKLLSQLANNLNEIHLVNHNKDYWRIFIGPWLGNFVQVIFDRWQMIDYALKKYDIDECKLLIRPKEYSIPLDMTEFIEFYISDNWNESIYTKLIIRKASNKLKIKYIKPDIEFDNQSEKKLIKLSIKKISLFLINLYNSLSWSDNSSFFISSYLPKSSLFSLQFYLKQWPTFFFKVRPKRINISSKKRNQLKQLIISSDQDNEFEKILKDMISDEIPITYLEGYKALSKFEKKNKWPSTPKNIFTATAQYDDDVFKFWAAQKKQEGSKLIIYQHGGNFGMTPFSFHEEHQIKVADIFLSWGWKNGNPKVTPLCNLNNFGEVSSDHKSNKVLLIQTLMPRYSYHLWSFPISSQTLKHDNGIQLFYHNLRQDIKKEIVFRPYTKDFGWDNILVWKDKFPNIKISNKEKLINLYSKSKINVHTYNATSFLESLSQNTPTLMFWSPIFWELNDEAKKDFNLLQDVGIFHESEESASIFLELIWDNTYEWWDSEETQNARKKFILKYNDIANYKTLKKLLKTG